ncbi:MAG TPA: phosphatase PAP2 family protein [Planctomycetota bacterium]|jgi:hypothetical protein|nr:phosphatase PAP2 family protein [Planctomycetota bacterium]
MKKLAAFDLVILGYIGIVTAIVLAFRPEGTLVYLAYHVAAVGLIALLVTAYERFGGRFWTFCRFWYVLFLSGAAFREMHYLIPDVHPFEDNRFDRVLAALDRRCFGNVDGFFLNGWPLFIVDLLHLCYWFYFLATIILGAALYSRKDWTALRQYLAVVMTGLLVSYLGYFLVPAIGPHHFYDPRPPQLDGLLLGKYLHQAILAAEWRMPDAFPSGHALLSMIVIVMSWRLHRPTFRVVLGPALGCVLATMALRYHYVVDVVASAALLPGVVCLGLALSRRWDRTSNVSTT